MTPMRNDISGIIIKLVKSSQARFDEIAQIEDKITKLKQFFPVVNVVIKDQVGGVVAELSSDNYYSAVDFIAAHKGQYSIDVQVK